MTLLKKWVVVETGHWMTHNVAGHKFLATKNVADGSDAELFEKERGFFGGECEKTDSWKCNAYGPTLKDPHNYYAEFGWTLHALGNDPFPRANQSSVHKLDTKRG